MKILEKIEKLANTMKLVEGIIDTTQTQSPKLQRIFKGIESLEQVHTVMKQTQQIQELLQIGKPRKPMEKTSLDNIMPLLLLLLNNFTTSTDTTEEENPDIDKAMSNMEI